MEAGEVKDFIVVFMTAYAFYLMLYSVWLLCLSIFFAFDLDRKLQSFLTDQLYDWF